MKKIGKKKILGIALLTSLSIFAGTTTNNTTRTTTTTNNTVNNECRPPHRLQKDSNGNLVDENGNIIKKPAPARIEELKTKLNNGKITKAEGAEIAKMLDRRGPHKPNDKCKPKDAPKRLTDTEIQSLTNSLNSGKVSKDEAAKLIEMLNHRFKGSKPNDMPLN
ncbi:hypothetical protein [Leptotrichia shahii]|uniref:hypothetical protein n=1 Tax=Leptotrichia shahii TaxID=157691 RepID=UPI0028D043AB|nr:hypothetical protein [Leptotrichia shahii]